MLKLARDMIDYKENLLECFSHDSFLLIKSMTDIPVMMAHRQHILPKESLTLCFNLNLGDIISMDDFIFLSRWTGRFGNRMFQYAYGATYSQIHQVDFMTCSDWEGSLLFDKQAHNLMPHQSFRTQMNQLRDKNNADLRQEIFDQFDANNMIKVKYLTPDTVKDPYIYQAHSCFGDLCADNKAIFEKMDAKYLRQFFQFSDEVKATTAYQQLEKMKGTYHVAHLRRDDISNPNTRKGRYSVISIDSYKRAFEKNGIDEKDVLWVSDDYTNQWAEKLGFSVEIKRLGWSYPGGSGYEPGVVFDWLEDFLKLYFAKTIFRANSSFSWWAGFLSPTANVYSPRLTERKAYGKDNILEEIDVEFEKGNQPHWVHLAKSRCPDIIID
jgi:hypothetical protein